jgi:Uri superfamily endonuclease
VLALNGIYALIIQLSRDSNVTVGKLGALHFTKGLYAYVGSAQIALEKRIARHLKKEKRVFWHIDYLLQNHNAKILRVFTKTAEKQEECVVAKRIAAKGKAVASFGCSDCRCTSHLFRIRDYDFLSGFMQEYNVPNLSAVS